MCWMTVRHAPNAVANAVADARAHEGQNGHAWGLAVVSDGEVFVAKGTGTFPDGLAETMPTGEVALAHTRFATRGGQTRENAHPFVIRDADGQVAAALAHNGTWYAAPDTHRCDSYYIARELQHRYRRADDPDADFAGLVHAVGLTTGETITVVHRDGDAYAYSGRFEITTNGGGETGAPAIQSTGGTPIPDGQVICL